MRRVTALNGRRNTEMTLEEAASLHFSSRLGPISNSTKSIQMLKIGHAVTWSPAYCVYKTYENRLTSQPRVKGTGWRLHFPGPGFPNKTRGIVLPLGHSFAFGTTVTRAFLPQTRSARILLHRLSGDILIGRRPIAVFYLSDASRAINGM